MQSTLQGAKNSNTIVFIDSSDRNTWEDSTSFKVDVDTLLGSDVQSVSIQYIQIPTSYYRINSTNNTFLLGVSGSAPVTVTVPVDNYNITNFVGVAGALATAMNAAGLGVTFDPEYNTSSGNLVITASSGDFFITTNGNNNAYLGMAVNVTQYSASSVLTSSGILDLSGTKFIEVRSDLNLNSSTTINYNRNVLARIPVSVAPFNTIIYTSQAFVKINSRSNFFNSITLSLWDDRGSPLDLNGADWSMCMVVSN